jgi:hypothetical protein
MLVDAVKQTLMITSFVMVMMLMIEYFNIRTRGRWTKKLEGSGWAQYFSSVLLGIFPGCLGTYAVVSLFTHRIITLGALLSALIATTGDEAFIMFSVIPGTAIKLNFILVFLALFIGMVFDALLKRPFYEGNQKEHMVMHHEDAEGFSLSWKMLNKLWINLSFERAFLIFGLVMFVFGLLTGFFTHNDSHIHIEGAVNEWPWMKTVFLLGSGLSLFIVATVPEHFLEHHLWDHIVKKHFPRIFLWTLTALIAIALLLRNADFEHWLQTNQISALFIAILVGIIPISGPHIIFISLFASGNLPFSILLANSIMQDGHGALPLFAESKKNFFLTKLVKFVLALAAGFLGLALGF